MVTNYTLTGLDGNTVTGKSNFTATHQLNEHLRIFGGRYSYELDKVDWGLTGSLHP